MPLTNEELKEKDSHLRRVIETLWQTRALRELKLSVDDEVDNALSYYRYTFFSEIPKNRIKIWKNKKIN